MVEDFHRSYITEDKECDINEIEMIKKHNHHLEKDLKHRNYRYREEKDMMFMDKHKKHHTMFEKFDDEMETESEFSAFITMKSLRNLS